MFTLSFMRLIMVMMSLCFVSVSSFSATRFLGRTKLPSFSLRQPTLHYRKLRVRKSSSSLAFQNNGERDSESFLSSIPSCQNQQNKFCVTAPYPPTADQPQAIQGIVDRVENGDKFSILRGCTGTGKTFVMAHSIAKLGKPTLVLCHNKTLAAQLARELRSFLKKNHVQLFVSYYNHYVPESYSEVTGKHVAKKSSINDDLDALRHMATRALVQHRDVVVVASVSCIYGLGMPKAYLDKSFTWYSNGFTQFDSPQDAVAMLKTNLYEDVEDAESNDLLRGQFQLSLNSTAASIAIWPPSEHYPIRVDLEKLDSCDGHYWTISQIFLGTSRGMNEVTDITIFPAKHHISDSEETFQEALRRIQNECTDQCQKLRNEGKAIEADRLQLRVGNDLILLKESGSCSGVENYSRHFNLREAGQAPDTLLDYFGIKEQQNNWMLMIDESHVTMPQLRAMYAGDRARKEKLVKHGYRLPSALDNRPLRDDEFWNRVTQTVFVSATPGPKELQLTNSQPVDMTIRPTFLPDPIIEKRPLENQLDDLTKEIEERAKKNERTLVLTLTKKDAEDLSTYLTRQHILADYIHSGLKTHERSSVLKSLQEGDIDCLVGVNILREGLDLPQVSLVAILGADSEGFLRSETALLQMVGRAARNINGKAILYANRTTKSMKACMEATNQRRDKQLHYNQINGKEMRSTAGSSIQSIFELLRDQIEGVQTLKAVPTDGLKVPDGYNSSATQSLDSLVLTDHVPTKPGVYFWKDSAGNILYIGKAKKLRSRVKSYLAPRTKHSQRIKAMLRKACDIEFILTESERDALLLESNLIKHHQPPYNVLLKDDESYPYICATIGDPLPSFALVPRKLNTPQARNYKYFGPYPSIAEINQILMMIEDKYNLRAKNFQSRFGNMTKPEYRWAFNQVLEEVFLAPASDSLSALRFKYEEASRLFQHAHNAERDIVSIVKFDDGVEALVHVVQLRNGFVAGRFSYSCKLPSGILCDNDMGSLIQAVLVQKHYSQGNISSEKFDQFRFFPEELLVQYSLPDARNLRALFREQVPDSSINSKLTIRTPTLRGARKDTDKRAMQFAIENANEVMRQRILACTKGAVKASVDGTASTELAKLLSLDTIPNRIEAYDISHTQGDVAVGSRVVFEGGLPLKKDYRLFNIRTVHGIDDYASIEEIMERRFRKVWMNGEGDLVDDNDPWKLPDLVVIDGGKGQLMAAQKGMARAGIFASNGSRTAAENTPKRSAMIPIVSLAKKLEEVFAPNSPLPVNDSSDSNALLLLRSIRDESHRFALTRHQKRRSKLQGLKK